MPETTVQLPEGMTPDQFIKLYESFLKSRVATAKRDKAVRGAVKDLIAAHKAEYERFLAKHEAG